MIKNSSAIVDAMSSGECALNSRGLPLHVTEGGVANFRRWFGESQAIDQDGRPLVLFHGTATDFSAFDEAKHRSILNRAYHGDGFHFSEDSRIASRYAWADRNELFNKERIFASVRRVFPSELANLFVDVVEKGYDAAWEKSDQDIRHLLALAERLNIDINNFLDLTEYVEGAKSSHGRQDDGFELFSFFNNSRLSMPDYTKDGAVKFGLADAIPVPIVVPVYLKANNVLRTESEEEALAAQANGYDAVYYSGDNLVGGVPEWVVFSPLQIKSAVGNSGAFDPFNPDFSDKDLIEPILGDLPPELLDLGVAVAQEFVLGDHINQALASRLEELLNRERDMDEGRSYGARVSLIIEIVKSAVILVDRNPQIIEELGTYFPYAAGVYAGFCEYGNHNRERVEEMRL